MSDIANILIPEYEIRLEESTKGTLSEEILPTTEVELRVAVNSMKNK